MTKKEQVLTHGGVDRSYRLCRCAKCGHESRCTPDNDFYTAAGDPSGPLLCESCMTAGRKLLEVSGKQLELYPSLAGTVAVGWLRDDLKSVVHQFANCKPGERFQPRNAEGGPHWPCKVCDAHGYTEAMFHVQMQALMGGDA